LHLFKRSFFSRGQTFQMKWTRSSLQAILHAKDVTLLPYGSDRPLYASPISWTLERTPHECWAVFGRASSHFLESLVLAGARAIPPISRPWSNGRELHQLVHRVKLGTRMDSRLSAGSFTDYTARYGSAFGHALVARPSPSS
jgi:hypothetical protein